MIGSNLSNTGLYLPLYWIDSYNLHKFVGELLTGSMVELDLVFIASTSTSTVNKYKRVSKTLFVYKCIKKVALVNGSCCGSCCVCKC